MAEKNRDWDVILLLVNDKEVLSPGQFVRVRVSGAVQKDAVLLPATTSTLSMSISMAVRAPLRLTVGVILFFCFAALMLKWIEHIFYDDLKTLMRHR